MTLLEFARGPGMQWALIIFVAGSVWRLTGILLLRFRKDLSDARVSTADQTKAGLYTILSRSAPAHELEKNIKFQHYSGYLWHIGFFIVILFFVPHILFFKDIIGFGWPGLPTIVITVSAVITMGTLLVLLVRRLSNPVLKRISGFDDYFSWLMVFLPLLTGILAYTHLWQPYEQMLAFHLLSVEAMLVWYPFGKLLHAFGWLGARYQVGVDFKRRGVQA